MTLYEKVLSFIMTCILSVVTFAVFQIADVNVVQVINQVIRELQLYF